MANASPEFEKSFADLAYSYVNNNAPKLLDFMVGFQVLDQNDAETHAIGVFGFEVGGKKKDMYYAPVFFMNGKLKGQELLYNGTSDKFLPLEEAWVDFVLNKKTMQIGSAAEETRGDMGRYLPNYKDMLGQGMSKAATEFDPTAERGLYGKTILGREFDVTPALGMFVDDRNNEIYKQASENLSLIKVASENPGVMEAMAVRMHKDPEFTKMAMSFYTVEDLCGHEPEPKKELEKEASQKVERVPTPLFITGSDVLRCPEAQKEEYVKQGYVVVDERKKKQKGVIIEGDVEFTSPGGPGMYDVVFEDHSIKRCLILKPESGCTKIIQSNGKVLNSYSSPAVTLTTEPVAPVSDFKGFKTLKSGKAGEGSKMIVHLPSGTCKQLYMSNQRVIESSNVHTLIDGDGSDIIAPKGECKVIQNGAEGEKGLKLLQLGNIQLSDVFPKSVTKARKTSDGYQFSFGGATKQASTKLDAMKYLMVERTLSKEASDHVISQATIEGFDFIVKEANDGIWAPIDDLDDTAGHEPWSGARVTQDVARDYKVQGLLTNERSDYGEFEPDTYDTMRRAVSTKQKDIFDLTALDSLIKSTDTDGTIDKFLPDLVTSVDRLGRSLFMMYAHMDDFKERYGQEELNDLEESLKSAFSTNGKLVLFMKKRSISQDVDDQDVEL